MDCKNIDKINKDNDIIEENEIHENEDVCCICYIDNTNVKLNCKHQFHFNCLNIWNKYNSIDISKENISCPYCRQINVFPKPKHYDGIALFYFFTKFKRNICCQNNCENKEYPLNHQMCSKHCEPKYSITDLYNILNRIYHFHIIPLHYKKKLLYICCYIYQIYGDLDLIDNELKYLYKIYIYNEFQNFSLYINFLYNHYIILYNQNQDLIEYPNVL